MTINSVVKDCLVEIKKPTLVIAAVSVVFPWSTWPIVPILQWGLSRWNTSFCWTTELNKKNLRVEIQY